MQLNKFLLVNLVLLARSVDGKIAVGTPSLNPSLSKLFEDLGDMVTSCYGDRINGVGLVGTFPDTFIRTLSVQNSIPVTLLSNTTKLSGQDVDVNSGLPRVPIQFRYKLPVFIVNARLHSSASSYKEVSRIISNIRYSIWWNHMASFFIIDVEPGCLKYTKYLMIAWYFNILNAKVLCRTVDNRKTVITTYNPFTNEAPVAWQELYVYSARARLQNVQRPFFTFFRNYVGNKATCVDLDFDQSKNLGGFQIMIEGYDENKRVSHSQKFSEETIKLFNTHHRILSTVVHAMNGTPEHFVRYGRGPKLSGDMRLHPFGMKGPIWKLSLITYPHETIGFILVSQFRGHKSQLNKILTVIDFDSRVGLGIVYLITLAFFKFFVHRTLAPAILNIVRITCNTGFTNLPDSNAPRIFLTGLLFFVVTMQGIYQGNLASLLTTVIPLRDIDTMQDVVDYDYKIYGDARCLTVVYHPQVRKRFIKIYDGQCIPRVLNDPSAVCLVIGKGIVIDRVRKNALHTSTTFVAQNYAGYGIQWDSQFEHRINIILRKLVEADVLEPWELKCAPTELTEFQFDEEVKNNVIFKNIELGELAFAFVILGIGLVCATITYIAEVAIYSYKTRIVTGRVHRVNVVNMDHPD